MRYGAVVGLFLCVGLARAASAEPLAPYTEAIPKTKATFEMIPIRADGWTLVPRYGSYAPGSEVWCLALAFNGK